MSHIQHDPEDAELLSGFHWYVVNDGNKQYAYANLPAGGTIKMHRLILGASSGEEVDHVNGDGLDNRRANLRVATRAQNARNAGKRNGAYSSVYKGVYRHKGPGGRRSCWRAMIRIDGRRLSLGYFDDEIAAAEAYDTAAIEHHGEFAKLNFPEMGKAPQPEG